MSNRPNPGPLADLIRNRYGSQAAFADEVGVTRQTVTNWIRHNPRAIMKHADHIARRATYADLLRAVESQTAHLRGDE